MCVRLILSQSSSALASLREDGSDSVYFVHSFCATPSAANLGKPVRTAL